MKNLLQAINSHLMSLIIVCATSCGVGGDTAKSTDQANIEGAWLAITESQNGIKREVSYLYVFNKDTLNFRDETGQEMKYFFKLDTTTRPRLINIQPVDSLANATPVSVGYELHGDSLTIVVAPAGLSPTDISDKHNQELITCKRKSL